MKSIFNKFIFFFILYFFENNAYSLPDYRIKEICKKQPRMNRCIKNLKFKKSILLQGERIEIPVIPFKK